MSDSPHLAPDPGLQVQRTGLAWLRTSVSVGVVGLLLLRWLPMHGAVVVVPSVVAFAMSAWLRVTARSHYRWGLGVPQGQVVEPAWGRRPLEVRAKAQPGRVLLVLAGVLLLAAVGAWAMMPRA